MAVSFLGGKSSPSIDPFGREEEKKTVGRAKLISLDPFHSKLSVLGTGQKRLRFTGTKVISSELPRLLLNQDPSQTLCQSRRKLHRSLRKRRKLEVSKAARSLDPRQFLE